MPATTAPTLAITGATGALGGAVARLLAERGFAQRLVVRTPATAPELPSATVAQASYGDREAMAAALDGARTLFLVSGRESTTRRDEHRAVIDVAARAGVEHIVYTSFLGAAPDAVFTHARDHDEAERLIRASGMHFTLLRDNFYQEVLPAFLGDDDVLRGPAGDGRCSFVARGDVARVAAAVLAEPDAHADATYELTGPEAFDLATAAKRMSAAFGRDIRYHAESLDEAYASRAGYGAEPWEVDAWVSTYTAIAAGAIEHVSDDVERITGRPATPFEAFLRERAA